MTNLDVLAFHSYTPWIENTRNTDIGLGLVYFIKRIVSVLLKHSADVIVTPSTEYMYETTYKPFQSALLRLRRTYPGPPPPIIIAYPVQEPDSLFLHLIVAHELGHSVISEQNLTETVRTSASPTARNLLDQAAAQYASSESVDLPVAVPVVSEIFGDWITEVLCDGFAVGLLGPSFLLTAATFDPPFGGPKPSGTHPPFSLRTRLLLERLGSWGWRPLLDSAVPAAILSWIEARAALPQETAADYFLTLEQALEELSPKIGEEIENHLGVHRFKPDDYSDASELPARELRQFLANRVLPVQLSDGSAASPSAIILAGWFHLLSEPTREPSLLVEVVDDHDFQRFLTKALEMSAILEQWQA